MNAAIKLSVLAVALGFAAISLAQAPADAPAGTNGLCNDGTYSQSAQKKGACHGHKGVKEWYGTAGGSSSGGPSGTSSAATRPPTASAPMPASAAAPPAASAPAATATSSKKPAAFTPPADAAPGGGPGMVWVNSSTNVYHCPGDKWYGKTKHGEYMSEADAKAKGTRPDHGKVCRS
ncbi:MAG TPA: DUF3761 domain-containing protein, partial [Steroidobacteraceae bacterium]|jgi:hypothetical protein|nr:DUF3761 domain-containing protein [Steroidobacteraceae bacterium]